MIRPWVASVVLVAVLAFGAQETQKATPGSLTIEEVVRLSTAGLSDELIVARVKRNAKAFDLNADEIVALRGSGVSETVIKYLVDPALPYTPPAPPPPASAPANGPPGPPPLPPKPPSDPLALKVPPESGIYYLTSKQEFLALDLKQVVASKQPGKLSSLSGGLLKGHIIGSVIGPTAKIRVDNSSAVFFLRLPEKVIIDDLALLNLVLGSKRRDLDFGKKAGKPVFPVSAARQYESKEVAASLFRLSVPMSKPGEYLFFILGSGDDKKGLLGKGYDFGVD
jgi:hypothetical protein